MRLFNHPQVQKMFTDGNKYHFKTSSIDSNGNVVREIYFEESGDTASITLYRFDENGNEIYSNHDNSYEYHNKFDSLGNEVKSKRINFDVRNGTKEISYIETWERKFSEINKLDEVIESEKGKIRRKEFYEYDDGNLVNKTYFSHYDGKDEKYFEIQYVYENDKLIRKVEINHRDNEKEEINVTYKER